MPGKPNYFDIPLSNVFRELAKEHAALYKKRKMYLEAKGYTRFVGASLECSESYNNLLRIATGIEIGTKVRRGDRSKWKRENYAW